MILGISHVGIAVPDLEAASERFARLLGHPVESRVDARSQQVEAAFIRVGNADLELIRPTTSDSGVARFLSRRGTAIHHVCFEVDDAEAELRRLEAQGARLLTPHAVRDTESAKFRGYGWVHQDTFGGILVELVEHG